MRIFGIFICLFISIISGFSQSSTPNSSAENCGTERLHAYKMESDAAYREGYLRTKSRLDALKYAPVTRERGSSVDTIPVVIHVVHLGESIGVQNNISDEQIFGAMRGLNERFANLNGQGAEIEVYFKLATTDPEGCLTSGINRVDGSIIDGYAEGGITWDGSCGVDERLIKDLSKWPTWLYYNIWVVNDICGNIAGYAYYPNGFEYDGAVMGRLYMTYQDNTLAHELGHGFNLRHTFSGDGGNTCPEDFDCLDDGDEVCDTPPHRTGDCAIFNPCSTEGNWDNSRYNYMSYCFPDPGLGRFTADQRTRVLDAISVEPRSFLLQSYGLDNDENLQITSDGSVLCPRDPRPLTAQPAGGRFEIANGSGFIINDTLYATGGSEILIEYIVEDEFCTSSVFQNITVKPAPNTILKSISDTICIGGSTILTGLPSGGAYSILDGPGEIFSDTLIATEPGAITVLYEKQFSGCILRDTHTIASLELPSIVIEALTEVDLIAVSNGTYFQWVDCEEDYEPIPGATSDLFTATKSGSYAVVSGTGGCRDTSACYVVEITSSTQIGGVSELHVFPNPVADLMYVYGVENSVIRITDTKGVTVNPSVRNSGSQFVVDLSGLPGGIYSVQIITGGRIIRSGKVVKI